MVYDILDSLQFSDWVGFAFCVSMIAAMLSGISQGQHPDAERKRKIFRLTS